MSRPTKEDHEALELLLERDDLTDYDGTFVESLNEWTGTWTPRQANYFDTLCDRFLGGH